PLPATPEDRVAPGDLLQTLIWSPATASSVPIAQVAPGLRATSEETMIRRYGPERTIAPPPAPRAGGNSSVAFQRIRALIEGIELPVGYSLEWGGDHEQSSDAQQALASTLALPYLAMVLVTVLLFAKVRQPLMIWLVVPMALCGVTLGLL